MRKGAYSESDDASDDASFNSCCQIRRHKYQISKRRWIEPLLQVSYLHKYTVARTISDLFTIHTRHQKLKIKNKNSSTNKISKNRVTVQSELVIIGDWAKQREIYYWDPLRMSKSEYYWWGPLLGIYRRQDRWEQLNGLA